MATPAASGERSLRRGTLGAVTRLQRFRGFLARMNPTRDPSAALHGGLYVVPEEGSLGDHIQRNLALDPVATHLVLGGIGSGKTSEVLRAINGLSTPLVEVGDYVDYVDVSQHTRLESSTQSGVLLALAGRKLSRAFPKEIPKSKVFPALETLRNFSDGYTLWVPDSDPPDEDDRPDHEPSGPEDTEPGEYVKVPGVLTPPERPSLPYSLHAPTGALRYLRNVWPGSEHFVILAFDALDRLPQSEQFISLVRDDINALKQCNIGVIVVGPIRYIVGSDRGIGELFDHTHYKLAVDPAQPRGLQFLRRILRHRAGEGDLLPDACLDPLAHASGGVLRDLISLAKRAAEDAYTSGADQIGEEHVARAREAVGRGLAVGLDDEQITALRKVHATEGFVIRGPRELSLLETRRVLMYAENRWVVHPALAPLLDLIPDSK